MGFSERAKLTALAIVHIFETSKPFGDYSAVAVLNDGAGVSYGINQFTHRSGSLLKVINTYLGSGGEVGAAQMQAALPLLRDQSARAITQLSGNRIFKDALRFAGETHEMKLAQQQIAENFYLQPAIDACEGSGFVLPLSLAVIYDSINHGSYGKIRDRVSASDRNEKAWITEYVQDRDFWLESIDRLAVTDYRTDFFIAQIARGNWDLNLPLNVHGHRLTEEDIETAGERLSTGEPYELSATEQPATTDLPLDELPLNEAATQAATDPAVAAQPPTPPEEGEKGSGGEGETTFVPVTMPVSAPPPTGFMGKLKAQAITLFTTFGGLAGLKEWSGVQLSAETADLLKILLPTVLGLGFVGFLTWYVAEKVIGFKTLKMQSEIATNPELHNLKIVPSVRRQRLGLWKNVEYGEPAKPLSVIDQ